MEAQTEQSKHWYFLEPKPQAWLVDGLIPSDGFCAIAGKPKAGKSSCIRNLAVAVVKGDRKFLGRSIDIPPGTGRVLYVHLDRKDVPWRVAEELRNLGITQEDSERLNLVTAEVLPSTFDERIDWLKDRLKIEQPNLLIIDLLWQFINVQSGNDYMQVLREINRLQDEIASVGFQGAILCALHSRKATNPNDATDDLLGSIAQSGSSVCTLLLSRNRNEGRFEIMSDQTVRDDVYGEIEPTTLLRKPDGTLELGPLVKDLAKAVKESNLQDDCVRVLTFITEHPDCTLGTMMAHLTMSKKHINSILIKLDSEIVRKGSGVKGDPFLFSHWKPTELTGSQAEQGLAA